MDELCDKCDGTGFKKGGDVETVYCIELCYNCKNVFLKKETDKTKGCEWCGSEYRTVSFNVGTFSDVEKMLKTKNLCNEQWTKEQIEVFSNMEPVKFNTIKEAIDGVAMEIDKTTSIQHARMGKTRDVKSVHKEFHKDGTLHIEKIEYYE